MIFIFVFVSPSSVPNWEVTLLSRGAKIVGTGEPGSQVKSNNEDLPAKNVLQTFDVL